MKLGKKNKNKNKTLFDLDYDWCGLGNEEKKKSYLLVKKKIKKIYITTKFRNSESIN